MNIVLSGLDENACRDLLGDTAWTSGSFSWMLVDRFVDPAVWEDQGLEGRRLVWLYQSPVAAVADDAGASAEGALTAWLVQNRAALNLRRLPGINLLVVNVEKVSAAELRTELGAAPDEEGVASIPATGQLDEALRDLVFCLFWWGGHHYLDVFDALEAVSWPARDMAFGHRIPPDETRLFAMLDALAGAGPRREAARLDLECQRLQARLHRLQQDAENCFFERRELEAREAARAMREAERELEAKAAAQAMKEAQQAASDLRSENQHLAVQIDRARAELQAHDIDNARLRKQLADEKHGHAASVKEAIALRDQLERLHKELQDLAQSRACGFAAQQIPQSRLRRMLPARIRARHERVATERARQEKIRMLGASPWFDRDWYLETYPDVACAGMDPARHYLEFGWKEGRNPSTRFDTCYYLMSNVDVAKTGLNPLLHFIEHGEGEGRAPRQSPTP